MDYNGYSNNGYNQGPPAAYPPPAYSGQAYPPAQPHPNHPAYPPTTQPPPGPPPAYSQGAAYPAHGGAQTMVYNQGRLTPVDTTEAGTAGHETQGGGGRRGMRGKKTGLSMFNSDWAGTSFSDKNIRAAFIRKVYLILLSQLTITIGIICWFIFHEPTKKFIQTHSYLYYISYGVFLVMFITLYCCHGVRRRVPGNYICLFIFTLALSYMAASISSYHETNIVLVCMGITALVCICITLFVCQNKIDFTGGCCIATLFVLILVLVLTAIATIVVWLTVGGQWWLQVLLGGLAALVMSLMLAIDTHMILGGGRYELSPEEYVVAALDLYIDIVYLFLIILCMAGGGGGGR